MASYFNSRSSFRSNNAREDIDPMTSMSGIGDVMLVFACGLMTALVVAWNLDLGQIQEVELGEEIEDVQELEEELESGGQNYVDKGTVYQNPETGQYYLVKDDEDTYDTSNDSDFVDEDTDADDDGTAIDFDAMDFDVETEIGTEDEADSEGEV